ncbi:MAG: AI-2E family transporter [Clostridia bacterium]|nr:AI-2E family transporter [Clostridia bacterium]
MEKNKFENFDTSKNSPFRIKWFSLTMAIFWAFFIAMALSNVLSPYLSQIISGLLSGITPILVGVIGAFIFHRLVNFTENVILKHAFKNSPYKFAIKRTISILSVLIIIAAFFVLIISILVPKIIDVITELTTGAGDGWDQMVNNVVTEITSLIQRWFGADVDQGNVKDVLASLFDSLKETVFYIDGLMEFSMSLVLGTINFLMGMILTVLFLKDKERIARFSRRFVYANFKKERADEMCVLTANSAKILFDYVICKLIEFSILFVGLGLTYSILGLRFTWELALIIGIFNFIPYYGIYIGAVPSVLFTLIFNSMDAALYMALATFIACTIILNILIPIITGNKLKVSALIVTLSVVLGGAMFGFMGMLLAPPLAAIISVIVMGNIELKENHMKYMMQLNLSREKSFEEQNSSGDPFVENVFEEIVVANKKEENSEISSVKKAVRKQKDSLQSENKLSEKQKDISKSQLTLKKVTTTTATATTEDTNSDGDKTTVKKTVRKKTVKEDKKDL